MNIRSNARESIPEALNWIEQPSAPIEEANYLKRYNY